MHGVIALASRNDMESFFNRIIAGMGEGREQYADKSPYASDFI
jgi:hypothetical protein